MIHTLEPSGPLIVSRGQVEPSGPPPIRDVLELASIEQLRWPELAASITGPAAYVGDFLANFMVASIPKVGSAAQLFVGNPGPEGKEHVAQEKTQVAFPWEEGPASPQRYKANAEAIEWKEVKYKEAYSFFVIWIGGFFGGYAALAPSVEVEIGDTVRFNIGALKIEIPPE